MTERGSAVWAAIIAFCVGGAVYLLDRPSVYVFPAGLLYANGKPLFFGAAGGSLPAFAHTFSLSLLTAVVLQGERTAAIASCLLWLGIDGFLEIGQHPVLSAQFVAAVPRWFSDVPFLENTAIYFRNGTFDSGDLLATMLGAFAAYLTLVLLDTMGARHEQKP